jgi:alpha-mannosidase
MQTELSAIPWVNDQTKMLKQHQRRAPNCGSDRDEIGLAKSGPTFLLGVVGLLMLISPFVNAAPLWQIGLADGANAEFALAPGDFHGFKEDGFFVVGQSNPKLDWPYVQPGPGDQWGGSRPHTFNVLFALKTLPPKGECHLILNLLDTHSSSPPRLAIEINGHPFEKDLPRGAGDASVQGDPTRGKRSVWDLAFPAELLRSGDNQIDVTTLSGSWIIYDCLSLQTPEGAALGPVASGTRLMGATVPSLWLKDGERAVQAIELRVRHVGPAITGQVRIGNQETKSIEIRNGMQSIEVLTAARETKTSQTVAIAVEGRSVAVTNLSFGPPRIRELWVLPHSHVDVGYTHRQDEIVKVQIANLEKAMELARSSAVNAPGMRFKWNPEAVWSLDHYLAQANPKQREAFMQAVRRGDVGVDALYGNMLTGLCRPEELVQCLAFGARLSAETGVPVESASICDVPGWTWGMVPTMAAAGVKYFAIGPNFDGRVGTIHVWDNRPFYWKSQSGRERVFCWIVDNYHHLGKLEEHVFAHLNKLERSGFPYDLSFLFWVGAWPNGGVDNAPPDEKLVEQVLAWNAKYAAPRVVIGLAGEYFREFERQHGPKVPDFCGDLTPYWEDGAGSTSRESALNRASADRLSVADTLFAMGSPVAYPARQFDAAWKNVLLYSEHTWGAWNSISDPDDSFVLDQWKVKQAFALDADQQSRALLAAALPKAGVRRDPAIEVINPTQWTRTDLAVVPSDIKGEGVLDNRGRAVASQRLASGELVFLACAIPPFSAKRFVLTPELPKRMGKASATAHGLRTGSLSVVIDEQSGAISSLRLAGLNQELVDPKAPVALNDYRYVLGADAKGARSNGKPTIRVVDAGPLVASLQIESDAPGCNRLIRQVRVVDGLDRVELCNQVDRKSVREKDGVHFGFGFNVPNAVVRMETPWGVVRPNRDQLPGSCRNWFTVQRWVDISNPNFGITWAPLDAPLMEIGAITGNLMGSVNYHEWMTSAFESSPIFSWAQNNHWFTNYKIDQPGITTFRYVIRPHQLGYSGAAAARLGHETTRSLLVTAASEQPLNPAPLLRCSTDQVLIETVMPSQDGRALILRLFGVSGRTETVSLAWPGRKYPTVWQTDLTEKPQLKMNRRFTVPAYEVVNLRVEFP